MSVSLTSCCCCCCCLCCLSSSPPPLHPLLTPIVQSLFGKMMGSQEDLEAAAAAYMDKYLVDNSIYSTLQVGCFFWARGDSPLGRRWWWYVGAGGGGCTWKHA